MITLHRPVLTIACVLTAAMAPGALAAQEPPLRLSVEDAVEQATRFNEDVLVARAEEARASGQVREVRAQSLPEISANFGYNRNVQTPVLFFNSPEGTQQISIGDANEYSFGLNLRQPILDFSLGPARSAARLAADASASGVEAARDAVALQTRLDYYLVLLDESLVEVEEKALEQALVRLDAIEKSYEAGTGSEFDLLTAQVEVDNIRPRLIEARNRLAVDLNNLKRTIGVPLEREIQLSDSFPVPSDADVSLERAVDRALENRADLRAQRVSVALRRESLSAERSSALPTLSLEASLLRRASSDDFIPPERDFSQSTIVGVVFELPIFDGLSRSGRVQQAEAAVERERYRLQRLRHDVRLEVQQALLAIEAARERIAASESNIRRAERALEIARIRFANGLSTQVELSDSELGVTRARTNHAQALHAYAVARARLQAAMGER